MGLLKKCRVVGQSLLFLLAFLCAFSVGALCRASAADGDKASSQSKDTIQDLLLFWEEKDLFVETPTRNSKRISSVAENITVISAKEIEDMNAHNVSEVLARVPGIFVDFQGQDFGSAALYSIQGSTERHVLVLLDGIPWNFLSNGNAETITIPVRIIDKIEVVEGPGSSAWGSSLGGVINIITKTTGNTDRPAGSVSASYGQANSQDYNGEIAGKVGPLGYYLYGGRQESDGLRGGRCFERNSFFSKFRLPTTGDTVFNVSLGYSDPKLDFGDVPSIDIASTGLARAFHSTASFDTQITNSLSFKLNAFYFKQKFLQENRVLGLGVLGDAGDEFQNSDFDEQTYGAQARFVLTRGAHNAVFGVDVNHGELDERIDAGPLLQLLGAPAGSVFTPSIDRYAVYANDTVTFGRFSVTPGLRFDYNSVSGSFVSPSLGMTYKFSKKIIARASVARGFNAPPLVFTSGGALFLSPNQSLDAEDVWSYQAGLETNVTDYIWLKATLFKHDLDNALVVSTGAGPPSANVFVNDGTVKREGVELSTETIPFQGFSFKAGVSYANVESNSKDVEDATMYKTTFALKYDNRDTLLAQVLGYYTWWDKSTISANYDDPIIDINVIRKLYSTGNIRFDLFATAHNIFNGSQYTLGDYRNPERWLEGGIRVKF